MKIVNETNRNKTFGALREGDVFVADECTFLKIIGITDCADECFNAVQLINGELTYFNDFDKVQFFPDAFLTVK